MQKLFYLLWALCSLGLGGLAVTNLWLRPGAPSLFALALVIYYAFCFFGLIRAAFLPWGLLGRHRRSGYWLCLLLLPLALVPLQVAYRVWQADGYLAVDPLHRAAWLHPLLGWLQGALGYLGPLLLLGSLGLGMAALLLRALRGQVAR